MDSSQDRINIINGFVGSYPNAFVIVKQNELSDFLNLLQNYKDMKADKKRLLKFVINRANPDFWEVFDWFDKEFKKKNL